MKKYSALQLPVCCAYLRQILIPGARPEVLRIKRDRVPIGAGPDRLEARVHRNAVVVATASKLASPRLRYRAATSTGRCRRVFIGNQPAFSVSIGSTRVA